MGYAYASVLLGSRSAGGAGAPEAREEPAPGLPGAFRRQPPARPAAPRPRAAPTASGGTRLGLGASPRTTATDARRSASLVVGSPRRAGVCHSVVPLALSAPSVATTSWPRWSE